MRTRMLIVMGLIAASAGCTGTDPYGYNGYVMEEFFPFDGQRLWEFINVDDQTIPYKLVATLNPVPEVGATGASIYAVDYERVCLGEAECEAGWDHTLKLSSNQSKGTNIHGYETLEGVEIFDPPIGLTKGRMLIDEYVETVIGETTWRSDFTALEPCPVEWTDQWTECARLTLDDGSGSHALTGEYWAVAGYNLVAWHRNHETGQWRLLRAEYTLE